MDNVQNTDLFVLYKQDGVLDKHRTVQNTDLFVLYKQDGVLDKHRTMDNVQKHNICRSFSLWGRATEVTKSKIY
jgi:hypothetical protein